MLLWNKNILKQIQGDLRRKICVNQLWNVLDLKLSFCTEGQKCLGENTTKNWNFCVKLLKKAKKEHFANLDVNSVTDSKIFWQIVKPLFQIKLPTIKLVGNNEMIDCEIEIAKLFNEYFVNIFERLVILTKKTKHCFHKNR